MIAPTTAIATLWGVWLLGWLATARATAKTLAALSGASQLSYAVFTWVGAFLLFARTGSFGVLVRPILPRLSSISWTGVGFVVIGLGFATWARFHLGRLWSGRITLKENHAIVRSGPYGIVRHPIYTGLVVAVGGSALAKGTLGALIGFPLIVVGLVMKLRQEEQLLTKHFGAAYDEYRTQVHALVPYVW